MAIPSILLAAGASRRLGRPKQLVMLEGETLLARTIRVAVEAEAEPVFVVLGAWHDAITEQVDLYRVNPLLNQDWEEGIASSIRAGMDAIARVSVDSEGVLLLVCDQPRLSAEHLRKLREVFRMSGGAAIVASRYGGTLGIPAIFPAVKFEELMALRGDTGARSLLRDPQCPVIEIEFEGGECDIDTPDELAANRIGNSVPQNNCR